MSHLAGLGSIPSQDDFMVMGVSRDDVSEEPVT